jgi:RNA polymerase sigma-32 factor
MQSGCAISRGASIYLAEIRRFPMLEAVEEHMLATRWRECGDETAALQLLTNHLRLVAEISMDYRRYGLPTSDLISEGNVGLIQAMKRFDPDSGIRFSTYAAWWIKASILDYIMRSWSLVKIGTTVNHKKLFFNLSKAKRRVSALQQGDLDPEKVTLIANELGVAERDVVEMNQRISRDVSLNVPMNQEGDSAEWQDTLVEEFQPRNESRRNRGVGNPQKGAQRGAHGCQWARTSHFRGAPACGSAASPRRSCRRVLHFPRAGPTDRGDGLSESTKGGARCERAKKGFTKDLADERAQPSLNELAQEAPPRNDCYMTTRARGDAIRDAEAACTPAFARSVTATAA